MERTATKTAAKTEQKRLQARSKPVPGKPAKRSTKTPKRRAGDVEQPWQRAKLDPGMWPFPAPVHGKAGLTWAVLPTGEKVKWSDLGMDRRLEERLKYGGAKKSSAVPSLTRAVPSLSR